MEHQSVGKNLIYQRKLKGYSQGELAAKTEVTVRTIQRIEKGEVNPHLQTVKLLAAALNIEVDELLHLENPKEEAIQKKWLLLLHGTPLLGFVLPFCNVLFPLFLWIHKREDNPIYDRHGVQIVNFQITAMLLYLFAFVALLTIEKWGFILFVSVIPLSIIIVLANIIYAVKSFKCYYPLAIPFLGSQRRKITKCIILLTLLIPLVHCTSSPVPVLTRLDGTKLPADSLTAKIRRLSKEANVHGLAVAVYNNNQPMYQQVVGYKDVQTKVALTDSTNIYGASLSKAVFSVLVMKLVEDGVIDLDTPLESYLPKKLYEYAPQARWHDDYSDLKTDSLYHRITARMCLAHTAGFANWRFYEVDRKLRVNHIPGTKYSYSGEGFVYLQVVLEKLMGKGLEELAQELVFRPLGMSNSSYQWLPQFESDFALGHRKDGRPYSKDTDNEPRAGSTLETTFRDYSTFLTAVLNRQLISEASYQEIFSPQIRIHSQRNFGPGAQLTTTKYDPIKLSYGLGWVYFDTPHGKAVSKGGHGDGFQHYSILFPESNTGILIMTNSDNGEGIYKELLEYAIGDTYTPWEWSNYIPYQKK